MNKVNRRHFLMTSMALPVALKASALPSAGRWRVGRRRLRIILG